MCLRLLEMGAVNPSDAQGPGEGLQVSPPALVSEKAQALIWVAARSGFSRILAFGSRQVCQRREVAAMRRVVVGARKRNLLRGFDQWVSGAFGWQRWSCRNKDTVRLPQPCEQGR